jgi:amino acid permease
VVAAPFIMEGICEMIVMWPIPNAMIEFVAAFVDRDLAVIVGIAYWYWFQHCACRSFQWEVTD